MKLFFVMITFVLGTSYSFFNEEQIVLIDEKKLIHGDFSICDKLNKNYFDYKKLIKPSRVNKRRKKMGLEPIEDYLKYFGIIWDYEKYGSQKHDILTK